MIRDRLKKLEKLVQSTIANCPGCAQTPGYVLMPGDPIPTEKVRCSRCGREREPGGIRIIVPGFDPKNDLVGLECT